MEGVKIREVRVIGVKVPRKAVWSLQRGTIPTHSTFTLVKLTTEDGVTGWGEATIPFPTIKPLIETYLVDLVKGQNPMDIEHFHDRLDRVEMMVMERLGFWNPARAAVDIALHDLKGKYLNVPVWRLLGSRYRDRVPMVKNVGVGDVQSSVETAVRLREEGYGTVKMRVGADTELDVARMKAIYERLGPDIRIRADANQAWTVKTAISIIRRFEQYGLESIEQPLKRWDIAGARRVIEAVNAPVMADEGFWTADEAMLLMQNGAVNILHLYLSKCGGLYPAAQIVKLAKAFDVDVTLGERLPLGICEAADAHFAAALPELKYPCAIAYDLNEHDLLVKPLERSRGTLHVPEGPGLGIEVDEEKVAFYSREESA
jgi:L-alanine-DL-glutamate epimerase-like enolase superfamily enzyme